MRATILNKNIRLLHIAPDTEFPSFFKERHNIDYYNGDLDNNFADLKIDITKIEYNQNFFDVIICNHVLEQIDDDFIALKELFRVLRKDGLAILQSPISKTLETTYENKNLSTAKNYQRAYGQSDMRRIYGQDYQSRLESVGFRVKIYQPNTFLSSELIGIHGINSNEKIFIGIK